MKKSCVITPKVRKPDGEKVDSILYKELNSHPSLQGNRALVNYIYAQYLSNGEAALDAAGITIRDENGQHRMQDVYDFYEVSNIINTIQNPGEISRAKQNAGAVDASGNIIYYDNGIEALNKIKDFNDINNNAFVARIVRDGEKYIIAVEERNARTHWQIERAEEQIKLFNAVKHAFSEVGLDLEKLLLDFPNILNLTDIVSSINYLKAFQKTNLGLATQKEIKFLLSVIPTSDSRLARVITKWGDIESASRVIYDYFRRAVTLTPGEESLVLNLLNDAKNLNGLNITKIQFDLERLASIKPDTEAVKVSQILKELKQKYNIDSRTTFVVEKEIKNLAQAAANATLILDKRLKELEKKQGTTIESKQLQRLINTLMKELDNNRYYHGILSFLDEATKHIKSVEDMLLNVEGTPGTQEYTANLSSALLQAKNILKAYIPLLKQLSDAENFERDEGITSENLSNITQVSKQIVQHLEVLDKTVKTTEKSVIISILSDWMGWGNELPNGKVVTDLIKTIDDVSILEYLYSASRSSNPLLAALGTIVREAQDKRNSYIVEYNNRISRANHRLKKAGYKDTKWMYDSEGRIINPYDWEQFSKEYRQICKELKRAGLKGADFKMALQERINNELTEEVVVDIKSGRTERVPIFRKSENPLDLLSEAQLEYYSEIMQIKGELGTMLPDYARSHFLPPQVRSNSLWDSKGWKDFFNRIGSNVADLFRITEEDVELAGALTLADTVDGESVVIAESDYGDEPLKDIPVYHVRKLKDQSKLVTDFSGALQIMGASAINYKCLSAIESTAVLLSDYIQEQQVIERDNHDIMKASAVEGYKQVLVKRIFKHLKSTNVASIAEGYLEKELYGTRLKDKHPKIAKLVQSLLNYTRFKQLSTNVFGGTSNLLTGEYQIILEAIGGEAFTLEDYAWACAKLFGDNTIHLPGKFIDYITNNTNELFTLIGNLFDPINESYSDLGHKRYNGVIRNLFTYDYDGAIYGLGEYIIHYTVMYAMLHHEKVFLDGKEVSLYEAFEKTDKEDGTSELKLKEGVYIAEKNDLGEIVPGRKLEDLNDEYIQNFRGKIRSTNHECHGAMNSEDRGVISQRLLGRAAMQFRQWMVESYSKRYRGMHWDGASKQFTEGWWTTFTKFLGREEGAIFKYTWKSRLKIKELDEIINKYEQELVNRTIKSDNAFKSLEQKAKFAKRQKKNIKAAIAEMTAVTLLNILSAILWANDDEDNVFLRFIMYLVKRLTWDATAISPVGVPSEGLALINRPVASVSTVSGLAYPVLGLLNGDVTEDYEQGIHKGENKYLVKSARLLPLYKDIEKWEKMIDEDHKYWSDMVMPYQYGKKYY